MVGAGWAGLAAALALAEAGGKVTLFDAAPTPGGRARTVALETPLGRISIDNGQHLIVGAYREAIGLIERLGAGHLLRRHPLSLSSPAGLSLRAPRLPAPLHLGWAALTARGLGPGARGAMLRLMLGLRLAGWRARDGETVAQLLARFGQPGPLVDRLWAPLCIGALNTMPGEACAAAFAAVLRDTLGADRAASDFVGAEAPLGSLLPEPALDRLRALGAEPRLREPVRRLALRSGNPGLPDRWRIGDADFDAVVLALPPWSAARLLEASGVPAGPIARFEPEPIATAWALWPADAAPALPRWSLLDEEPARDRYGQWLFDRGTVAQARLAGIVISAASRLDGVAAERIAAGVSAQLADAFGGPPPAAVKLVTERRATFRCTPGRPRLRPDHLRGQAPGLWLAGDWLWPDYPATLEAAVRSGGEAANMALAAAAATGAPNATPRKQTR
ncbi:hydroxysqualene dehydroxylase HpnE [Burkholderiaceae bacterium FT117]|uniref:hydroxysqualene dehydroxylase HpnE n=1 Tax=Zeimonas sediminis TaxID=2944268 RepID=UPI0023430EC7|nr:hydroxysqualene dehydroxylase HpnE [Zeimonas sediminis]MCM5569147.1 hydroxysqualene dehydroxylase HpnE [Zeimonas sediminis]